MGDFYSWIGYQKIRLLPCKAKKGLKEVKENIQQEIVQEVQAFKSSFSKQPQEEEESVAPYYGTAPVKKLDVSEVTGFGRDPYRFRIGGFSIGGFKMPSYSYRLL